MTAPFLIWSLQLAQLYQISSAIKWLTGNGMQAKPNKFQFMMISRDEHSSQSLILNQSTVIVSDDHVKLFGVVIDSKLKFSLLLL